MSKENKSVTDFLADINRATVQGPLPFTHLILWITLAFIVIGLSWAKLAIVDEVTHAEGKVIPSRQVQIVQNLEGGIVREILVREGQNVEKNQILMVIDDTRFASTYGESRLKAAALKAKIARLEAEADDKALVFTEDLLTNHPNLVANERSLYHSRKLELDTRITTYEKQISQKKHEVAELQAQEEHLIESLELVQKELQMTKPLVNEGAVSEVEVLRLERQVIELKSDLTTARLTLPRVEDSLAEIKNKISELKANMKTEVVDELTTARAEFDGLEQTNKALEDRVERTTVRSPVRGTVKQIYINTVGGVIKPGMELMEVVPTDDTLLVEAHVKPADIAFIHPNLKAMVKISAYDFSVYGGLEGKVEHISADTITDDKGNAFYEIRVRTKRNYLEKDNKTLPIIPGMQTTVDILTGEKSILDYILKPILKTKQNALRER